MWTTYTFFLLEKGKQPKPWCGQRAPSHGETIDWLCGAAIGLTQLRCCVSASLASFSSPSPKESYGSIRHGTFRRPLHHAMGPRRGENRAFPRPPPPPSTLSAADWRGAGRGDNNSCRETPYPCSSAWPTWRIFRFGNLWARYIYEAHGAGFSLAVEGLRHNMSIAPGISGSFLFSLSLSCGRAVFCGHSNNQDVPL